ncbi:hypothetical protein Ahy_A02g009337 [Arachis hypogaea]|uniref:U-box domain-containing protein n=1 Tax=Arachis hypogaea TaxID=3818 RepID=A0A445EGQ3_ARAHY|nr:hypothetical protein Ahy_A02g009337 [Arachis hypogaea]
MKEKPRDFGMSSTSATRTRNKTRIIKCGALPVLLNHLHSQSQTVVQLTVAAMLTLSSCKANKVAIASSGALQHLAEFVIAAIGLLENIVSSSESALCEAASVGGAIRILVETIEDGSSLGKEHAFKTNTNNHELIERIMEEIDADGEKLADAKLRLVKEMIAKLNT